MIFIIGEIGINHNGDIEIAKELIKIAKDSGCNAVKFQKRDVDVVYSNEYLEEKRQSPFGITQREQKEALEFGENEYNEIDRFCKLLDIDWFVSVWDINSLKFIDKYDLKYNKICSPMIDHVELLHEVAKRKKYTFISTGMSSLKEINRVVRIFKNYDCPFELLHCVSIYPTELEHQNLLKIKTLKKMYNCKVGFSDHSISNLPAYVSVGFQISSYERHITLDRFMYGSDQKISTDPKQLGELIQNMRLIEKSLGNGELFITNEEMLIKNKIGYNQ